MPIHPRNLPTSREEQQWNALGDLRRQAGKLDRARASSPQRASSLNATPQVITTGPSDLGVLATVAIPDSSARSMLWWAIQGQLSNGATSYNFNLRAVGTISGSVSTQAASVVNDAAPFILQSGTYAVASGGATVFAQAMPILWQPTVPTVEETVAFTLRATRTAGVGTASITAAALYLMVL